MVLNVAAPSFIPFISNDALCNAGGTPFYNSHHFTGLLGEAEGVWEDVDVGGSLQLISTVGGDVELYVISL